MAYTLTTENEAEIVRVINLGLAGIVIPAANADVSQKAALAVAVTAGQAAVSGATWAN